MSGDDLISIPCAGCGRGDAGVMTLRVADGRHAWFCDGCAPEPEQPMSLDDVRAGLEQVYGPGSMTDPATPRRRPRPPKPLARRFTPGLKPPADGSPRHEVREHERLTAVERAAYERGKRDGRAEAAAELAAWADRMEPPVPGRVPSRVRRLLATAVQVVSPKATNAEVYAAMVEVLEGRAPGCVLRGEPTGGTDE